MQKRIDMLSTQNRMGEGMVENGMDRAAMSPHGYRTADRVNVTMGPVSERMQSCVRQASMFAMMKTGAYFFETDLDAVLKTQPGVIQHMEVLSFDG